MEARRTLGMYHAFSILQMKRHDAVSALRELQATARGEINQGGKGAYRPKTQAEFEAFMAQAGMIRG